MGAAGGPCEAASAVLEQLFLRDRHGDFARLRLDHFRQRYDTGIAKPAQEADHQQESEQARHIGTR
jgi:hypothetical protein